MKLAISIFVLLFSVSSLADPIQLFDSLAGNINFEVGAATLRTGPNGATACNVTNGPVSAAVSGIPAGSTIKKAFLYWSGSGSTSDDTVTFEGSTVNAQRSFSETFTFNGTNFDFWQNYAEVTTLVNGNGNYTINNLTVNTGAPHCAVQAVYSGFAVFIVYENSSEDFRVFNIFDGLQFFRGTSVSLTPNNFVIPTSPINGRFAVLAWEGDLENSGNLNGLGENVFFNNSILSDGINPINNQYNSTITTTATGPTTNQFGVDLDSYDVSSLLSAGDVSTTSRFDSGADLVLLGVQAFINTNTPATDLILSKTHAGDFNLNQENDFILAVTNNEGAETTGVTTVNDTLPAGLDFVSAVGAGWT